jgi:hypothetical protein
MGFIRYKFRVSSVRFWGDFSTLMGFPRYISGVSTVQIWGVLGTLMGFRYYMVVFSVHFWGFCLFDAFYSVHFWGFELFAVYFSLYIESLFFNSVHKWGFERDTKKLIRYTFGVDEKHYFRYRDILFVPNKKSFLYLS